MKNKYLLCKSDITFLVGKIHPEKQQDDTDCNTGLSTNYGWLTLLTELYIKI